MTTFPQVDQNAIDFIERNKGKIFDNVDLRHIHVKHVLITDDNLVIPYKEDVLFDMHPFVSKPNGTPIFKVNHIEPAYVMNSSEGDVFKSVEAYNKQLFESQTTDLGKRIARIITIIPHP